jgi:hypothetical protein
LVLFLLKKKKVSSGAGGVIQVQVVEPLPSKGEALISTYKKKKKYKLHCSHK